MTSKLHKSLRIILPLLLGGLLIVLLYRKVDFEVVRSTLASDVRWEVIALTCLLGPISVLFRALRWDLQVEPLRREGMSSTLAASILHVQGSYAVNMAIPRLGDLWRCTSMQGYTGLPFSRLLGTMIAERAVDMITTLLLIIPGLALNATYFTTFLHDYVRRSSADGPAGSPRTWLLLTLALLLVVFLLRWLIRRFQLRRKLQKGWLDFLAGLRTIGEMSRGARWLFLLYTLGIWLCYFFAFYLTFQAFSFTEGLGADVALVIFSLITISSILPVQGNIGPWHFVVIQSLIFFGVAADPAASFALIVHASQTATTTLVGLVAILLLPLLRENPES